MYAERAYVPRGKVAALLEKMQACPDKPVWPAADVARAMDIAQANVPAYVGAVLKHKMLYSRRENGLSYFSLSPFPEPPFVPAKMTPPRGESEPIARNPLPAPLSARAAMPPAPPPPEPVAQEPEPEPEREGEEFNACLWLDGDLDVHGLTDLADGGHRINARDVLRLRRLLAWMPT